MVDTENIRKLHDPVMLPDVIEALKVGEEVHLKSEAKVIDATVGLGGHTEALVKSGFKVLGIDTDKEMLELARKRLELACPTHMIKKTYGSYKLVFGNFRNIDEIARANGFDRIFGILFDLGVSSPQIVSKNRGFSFQNDSALLDMRIDRDGSDLKASDLVNSLRGDQLEMLFRKVLGRNESRKLSKELVKQRAIKKVQTVGDLKKIVRQTLINKGKLDASTLPFLALRMAVNSEIENIAEALPKALGLLIKGGRIVVISFHSGEDSLVKNIFREWHEAEKGVALTKKPIVPSANEVSQNRRARSAKMRVFQKN